MIVVTGASGFIGGALVARLQREGLRPRLLVRDVSRLHPALAAQAEIVVGDLADSDALARVTQDARIIYHCAANVRTWDRAAEYQRSNVQGTANLLAAATAHATQLQRFVFLSSADVYGFPFAPCDEHAPTPPTRFGYGNSKIAAERCVREWAARTGGHYTIFRPCNVLGRGSPFIERIGHALQHELMLTINRGRSHGGFLSVTHLIDYLRWAADAPQAANGCYNMRDAYEASWADFIAEMCRHLSCRGRVLNLPYGLAVMASEAIALPYQLLQLRAEPLLHPLLVRIFGRTCGHDASLLRADSGLTHTATFAEVMQACFADEPPHA